MKTKAQLIKEFNIWFISEAIYLLPDADCSTIKLLLKTAWLNGAYKNNPKDN